MAFERFSINTNPNGNRLAYQKPATVIPKANSGPRTGGGLPPFTGGELTNDKPVLGGDGPAYNPIVNGTTVPSSSRQKIDKDALQRSFQAWVDSGNRNSVWNPFLTLDRGKGGPWSANKPPTTPPGSKPTPQWSFQPSPYDQPSYQTPMGNAASYTINPPAQPWMFDPATYGAGAPPQWYGQPVVPNSQPPFRY